MSLLTQGQGSLPQASPQSLGNTLSPAVGWGVCIRATATYRPWVACLAPQGPLYTVGQHCWPPKWTWALNSL